MTVQPVSTILKEKHRLFIPPTGSTNQDWGPFWEAYWQGRAEKEGLYPPDGQQHIYIITKFNPCTRFGAWTVLIANNRHAAIPITCFGKLKENTTEQEMGLTAFAHAIKYLKTLNPNIKITIFTNSDYLVNGATKWIFNWYNNQWKKANGDDVKYSDIWQYIYSYLSNKSILILFELKQPTSDFKYVGNPDYHSNFNTAYRIAYQMIESTEPKWRTRVRRGSMHYDIDENRYEDSFYYEEQF